MNVLFVSHCDFRGNSAMHIFSIANALAQLDVCCTVSVPGDPASIELHGSPAFEIVSYANAAAGGVWFPNGRGPDIIHAWTPRELVRKLTEALAERHSCPYVVHLEDNEEVILETESSIGSYHQLARLPLETLDELVPEHRSHPIRYRSFLNQAAGVTALMDTLLEFKPPSIPGVVFWPGFDEQFHDVAPATLELRRRFQLSPEDRVLVYNGNIHHTNAPELRSLFLAVRALLRGGMPIRVLRTGCNFVEDQSWIREAIDSGAVVELGFLPRAELPALMSLADVLVQPGRSDRFNDYRFPSKLPEFFVSGKPVVLPASNIGRFVRDGEEALLLREGHAVEIAEKIERVVNDPGLASRIGGNGREFALRNLSWPNNVPPIKALYEEILRGREARTSPLGNGSERHELLQRYGDFRVESLSYATVDDYCDSFEHLHRLATANGDLKDCQRPWVLKAILAKAPPPGAVLEIGAGEPLVAGLLSRLGYDAWIVDPYDGSGNGPTQYEQYREQYPDLTFVRAQFHDRLPELEQRRFDCIYSISVLEHIPSENLPAVFAGIKRFLKPSGMSIHAVDHVHRGNGAAEHLSNLRLMVDGSGFEQDELDRILEVMTKDTETYYLSAESHNRWRGATPYGEFPMRVCVSIQLVAEALRVRNIALKEEAQRGR